MADYISMSQSCETSIRLSSRVSIRDGREVNKMELTAIAGPAADVELEVQIAIFDRHGEVSRLIRKYRANRGWLESTSDVEECLRALAVLLRADDTYTDLALCEVRGW